MTPHLPPHDPGVEQALLGCLLLNGAEFVRVMGVLQAEDFASDAHQDIYRACQTLHKRGEPIDQITVASELGRVGKLEKVGGPAAVLGLSIAAPTPYELDGYLQDVLRFSRARQLIALGSQITQMGYGVPTDGLGVVAGAKRMLDAIYRPEAERGDPTDLADVILSLAGSKAVSPGLHLPWPTIEGMTGPLRPGQVWVVGARTELGKTTTLLQIGLSLAREGRVVLYATGEELVGDTALRVAAMLEGIDIGNILRGQPTEKDEDGLVEASGWVGGSHFWRFRAGSLADLDRAVDLVRLEEGRVDLVLMDYLQCLVRVKDSRYEATTSAINALKDWASEWAVPLVVASQLSRDFEHRADKRPTLADLRDSGAIEQDAHIVLFLHRPEDKTVGGTKSGETEFIVAKNRLLGRKGVVKMGWDPTRRSYEEM